MVEETRATDRQSIIFADEDLKKSDHDEIMLWLDTNVETLLNQVIYPGLTQEQIDTYLDEPAEIKKSWQQPIISATGEIVGFIDMIISYDRADTSGDDISKVFFFDVRTEIPSLGELIREINTYKLYLGFEESWIYSYVVICPDDRYAGVLKSQEIDFWQYDQKDVVK